MKNLILLSFLMGTAVGAQEIANTSKESLGLMPYVALTRTNSGAEIAGEEETATGYEVGAEYEWIEKDAWKSASRLSIRNLNTDTGMSGLFSYEMEMNILSVGQSLTYDIDLWGSVLKPFTTIDVGLGLAKSRADIFGETYESDTKALPYANFSLGARYVIGEFVPFMAAGYQHAKAEIEQVSESFSSASEIDYSGTYFSVGVGMVF